MDADILQELYTRYYSRALLYTLSLCGDEELAKDLTAEAFVKAYLTLPEETPSFPFWLLRVCRNLWLDHVRKHSRLTSLEEAGEPVCRETPETVYLKQERSRCLWRAVGKLPAPDREILTLHYFSGLPLQQVASLVGLSYGAVRQRLSRLRRTLRQEMEEQGYDIS
ncbi:MAG: sigma-70 family RNA polymerase sigma factor [Oscillospiraceae bacterium]|nr:sigma-70 family RNA polymerase sigma factor [Oscillospiraceae bacterium]